jgi:aspartate-semialdehyde dehydrogenase
MSRVVVLSPTTLLGREVRDLLDADRSRWQQAALLSTSEEEVGTVTEAGGAAALVSEASAEALAGVDVVFACGALEEDLPVLERRPEGSTAILLAPEATVAHGQPVVADLNPDDAVAGRVLVSPHPAAIALSYLLAPLGALGPESAVATVVEPVSMLGDRGLEDLLGQTRDILAMAGERRESVFERQLAFNLYPSERAGSGELAALVRGVGGGEVPLAVHSMQGAVFHGMSVSLFVRFEDDPGEEAVREALEDQARVSVGDVDVGGGELPGSPGPIDAAAREEVLVGSVRADAGSPGGYWIWAVMDNLTRGGAANAVEVARLVG